MQSVLAFEKIGDPKEIEPPDRVDQEFSASKRPGLPVREELRPLDLPHRFRCIAQDVFEFSFGAAWVVLRSLIKQEPQCQPREAERTDNDKGPPPAKLERDPRHEQPG